MSNRYRIVSAVLILALATIACGFFKVNAPVRTFKTGPMQTTDIQIPLPKEPSGSVEVNLEFIGGELKLAPGTGNNLVAGTATYNVADFEPQVQTAGSSYTVTQPKVADMHGIPAFQGDVKDLWDLQLAGAPMSLSIQAGAYQGTFELGGLSLEKLDVTEGGSQVTAAFSKPNQVDMSTFTYETGASKVELKGLANANFEQMTFTSGAGDYSLSFDGSLKRAANVSIDSGVGTVTVLVPKGVNAQVTYDGGLSTVKADPGWNQNGNLYSLAGSGPTITIQVKMGVGTLNLKIV